MIARLLELLRRLGPWVARFGYWGGVFLRWARPPR
jgi:hypothetical protein